MKDSVHRYYRPQSPDWLTAAMGASLRDRYGGVKGLKLDSSRTANMGDVIAIWNVSAERGGYQMKVAVDRSGKVIYLAFRHSATNTWKPAVQMAHEYIRRRTSRSTQSP